MRRGLKRVLKSVTYRLNNLADRLDRDVGVREVENGYFTGTKLTGNAYCSMLDPKIYGSYEKELWDVVWPIIEHKELGTFIDIGCAEGFYLAGFSALNIFDTYVGIDIDENALRAARKNLLLNSDINAKNIFIGSDLFNLEREHDLDFSRGCGLVLVDIEGSELELVNQKFLEIFKNYVIIIELHDFTDPIAFRDFLDYLLSISKRKAEVVHSLDAWEKTLMDEYSWEKNPNIRIKRMNEFRGSKMRWLVLY